MAAGKKMNGVHKHKALPGYKLAKQQHDILGWLPYVLSIYALAATSIAHHFSLPGYFYAYLVYTAYALYVMAWSKYFSLGR